MRKLNIWNVQINRINSLVQLIVDEYEVYKAMKLTEINLYIIKYYVLKNKLKQSIKKTTQNLT